MKNLAEPSILVVEDDPGIRRLMVGALRGLGVVTEAADGESAVLAVREHAPDLICLDLGLPTFSGYEVCEAIRRMPSAEATRILVVSGRTSLSDRAHAMEAGAHAFLPKPFRTKELVERAESLVQQAVEARRRRTLTEPAKMSPATATVALDVGAALPALRSVPVLAPVGSDPDKLETVSMTAPVRVSEVACD